MSETESKPSTLTLPTGESHMNVRSLGRAIRWLLGCLSRIFCFCKRRRVDSSTPKESNIEWIPTAAQAKDTGNLVDDAAAAHTQRDEQQWTSQPKTSSNILAPFCVSKNLASDVSILSGASSSASKSSSFCSTTPSPASSVSSFAIGSGQAEQGMTDSSNVPLEFSRREPAPAAPASDTTSSSTPLDQIQRRQGLRLNLPPHTPLSPPPADLVALIGDTSKKWSKEVQPSQLEELRTLGQGATGRVVLMRCASGSRKGLVLAVKMMPRFNRQIWDNIKKDLSYTKVKPHANVVKFYGTLATIEEIWLCMEPLDLSLRTLLDKLYCVGEKRAAHIALCIIRALAHLSSLERPNCHCKFVPCPHERLRICHRDLHPGNVIVSFLGYVKICDFGHAAELLSSRAITQTLHGMPCYLAPECREDPPKFGIRSDVWSMGVTVNEAATGSRLYGEPYASFDTPPELSDRCSEEFNDFVAKCLTVLREQRPHYPDLLKMPLLLQAEETFSADSIALGRWLRELRSQGQIGN